jgi:hypothetical protein
MIEHIAIGGADDKDQTADRAHWPTATPNDKVARNPPRSSVLGEVACAPLGGDALISSEVGWIISAMLLHVLDDGS